MDDTIVGSFISFDGKIVIPFRIGDYFDLAVVTGIAETYGWGAPEGYNPTDDKYNPVLSYIEKLLADVF